METTGFSEKQLQQLNDLLNPFVAKLSNIETLLKNIESWTKAQDTSIEHENDRSSAYTSQERQQRVPAAERFLTQN
jgi:septal ring factor EnvC (AmiA/AmiB activator)